jgi:hypothetical protein
VPAQITRNIIAVMAEPSSSASEAARRSDEELREAIEIIPAMVFIAFPPEVFHNGAGFRLFPKVRIHEHRS